MGDEQLLLLVGDVLHRKAHRRDRDVDNQVDLFGVVPAPRDASADVRLELMIAEMTVIGLPRTLPPKSSTAICAAVTEPWPVGVEAGPFMSVSTPILTTSSEIWAERAARRQQRCRKRRKCGYVSGQYHMSPPGSAWRVGRILLELQRSSGDLRAFGGREQRCCSANDRAVGRTGHLAARFSRPPARVVRRRDVGRTPY